MKRGIGSGDYKARYSSEACCWYVHCSSHPRNLPDHVDFSFMDLVYPDDQGLVLSMWNTLTQGAPVTFEMRVQPSYILKRCSWFSVVETPDRRRGLDVGSLCLRSNLWRRQIDQHCWEYDRHQCPEEDPISSTTSDRRSVRSQTTTRKVLSANSNISLVCWLRQASSTWHLTSFEIRSLP